jgi:predicted DCC family thiol-disulfide oxidoreductase YuxK
MTMPPAAAETHAVVLFDGECAFCERMVRFIATRDPHGYFRFGASQSPQARALLAGFGLTREMTRSIVLIEDGKVYLRSTASLRIAGRLTRPWSLARLLLAIPETLRDPVYRAVSAVRTRIAGRSNACEIPPAEIRARLI